MATISASVDRFLALHYRNHASPPQKKQLSALPDIQGENGHILKKPERRALEKPIGLSSSIIPLTPITLNFSNPQVITRILPYAPSSMRERGCETNQHSPNKNLREHEMYKIVSIENESSKD